MFVLKIIEIFSFYVLIVHFANFFHSMDSDGITLYIDFESSYCLLFYVNNGKAIPIRSGYDQKKYSCIFSINPKTKSFEVIKQEINGEFGPGIITVSDVLLIASTRKDDKDIEKIKQIVDVDIQFEKDSVYLVSSYKNETYSVNCMDLLYEMLKSTIISAKDFCKADIKSIVYTTSLELHAKKCPRVLSILNIIIDKCGVTRSKYIAYTDAMFSYYGVSCLNDKKVLLLHFDPSHLSFCVKTICNNKVSSPFAYSSVSGGYNWLMNELVEEICNHYKNQYGNEIFSEKVKKSPSLLQKKRRELRKEIDNMEISLKTTEDYEIVLGKGKSAISFIITKIQWKQWKQQQISKQIKTIVHRLLSNHIQLDDIKQVLVEGESCRDEDFQLELSSVFSKNQCIFDSNVDEVLAKSLSAFECKPSVRFASKNYGLLIAKDECILFIHQGTSLPCQVRKYFTTRLPNQREFMVYLICKDSPDNQSFHIIDSYYISGLQKSTEFDFEFIFQIDENGTLAVSCYEQLFEKELLSPQIYERDKIFFD